jgi:hypothetical protein
VDWKASAGKFPTLTTHVCVNTADPEDITRNIVIRKSAMRLGLDVFIQFEAPDYPPEGVETFKKDIGGNSEYPEKPRLKFHQFRKGGNVF